MHTANLQQTEFIATESSLQACEQALSSAELAITTMHSGEAIEVEVSPGRVCKILVRQHLYEQKTTPPTKISSSWLEVTTLPVEGVQVVNLNIILQTTVLVKHATNEIERHNWREIFIH